MTVFNPDGSLAEAAMPPKLHGSGPRGSITMADIRGAGGTASTGRRPPATPIPVPFPWGGRGPVTQVDLYDLNPLVTIVKALPAGPNPYGGEAPTMFSSGPLPLFTSSGLDVEILRFVPWSHRHSAASTSNAAEVYTMVEQAAELGQTTLQNRSGVEAFERYRAAVWRWATTPPPQPPNTAIRSGGLDDDRDVFNQLFGNP
jgi:hypothetical protein